MNARLLYFLLAFALCAPVYGQFLTDWDLIWIPAKEKGFLGEVSEIKLEATIYKPSGNGPFPLFILNHGSTGNGAIPEKATSRFEMFARLLVRYGFVVVEPMRRGRGQSGGNNGESERYYDYGPNAEGVRRAIEDIDSTIAYAKTQSHIDTSRIVIGGVSRGGLLSVIYTARRPEVPIIGVVNFVGGWSNDRGNYDFNTSVFEEAGKLTKIPTIWIYGENDSNYSNDSIKGYAKAFQKSGGNLTFKLYSGVAKDGHFVHQLPHLWSDEFHSFFTKLGFPLK